MPATITETLEAKNRRDDPIGTVIFKGHKIIAKASDQSKTLIDPVSIEWRSD